jgi:hypothetical protein
MQHLTLPDLLERAAQELIAPHRDPSRMDLAAELASRAAHLRQANQEPAPAAPDDLAAIVTLMAFGAPGATVTDLCWRVRVHYGWDVPVPLVHLVPAAAAALREVRALLGVKELKPACPLAP